jgi:hypothetical protein
MVSRTLNIMTGLLVLFIFAAAHGDVQREITAALTVPDPSWRISIEEVWQVGDELWVLAAVSRDPDVMAAQVISTVQVSIKTAAPDLPIKYFITGKTWSWDNEEQFTFLKGREDLEEALGSGRLIFRAKKPAGVSPPTQ